jgi:hypothetical protein
VRGSYQLLEGCPWPAPRPLYVLTSPQPHADGDGDVGATHTQRTRLPRGDMELELTAALGGRRRPDGSPLISCGAVVDGVVVFEDDEDAEAYGQMLAAGGAGGGGGVSVARCDSHELFRAVREARGVVVLLRAGCEVPPPHQLAAALRGQTAFDDE